MRWLSFRDAMLPALQTGCLLIYFLGFDCNSPVDTVPRRRFREFDQIFQAYKSTYAETFRESTEKSTLHREEAKRAKNLHIFAKAVHIPAGREVDAKLDS